MMPDRIDALADIVLALALTCVEEEPGLDAPLMARLRVIVESRKQPDDEARKFLTRFDEETSSAGMLF